MTPLIPQSRLAVGLLLSVALPGAGSLSPDTALAAAARGDTSLLIVADASATTASAAAPGSAATPSGVSASSTSPDAPESPTASAPSTIGDGRSATSRNLPSLLPDDDALPADADSIIRTPRFRQLAHELRCLVCQNQTLLDSHAPLAQDLRNEVIRLMASGMNDEQIKQFLVDRYGEFVLYRPSWSWQNALLWLGPALMLLVALIVGWRFARRSRTGAVDMGDRRTADAPGMAEIDALLADEGPSGAPDRGRS